MYCEAWAPDGNPHLFNADGRKVPGLRGGTAFHATGKAAAEQATGSRVLGGAFDGKKAVLEKAPATATTGSNASVGGWAALLRAPHKGEAWQPARRHARRCGVVNGSTEPHLQRGRQPGCSEVDAWSAEAKVLSKHGGAPTATAPRTARATAPRTGWLGRNCAKNGLVATAPRTAASKRSKNDIVILDTKQRKRRDGAAAPAKGAKGQGSGAVQHVDSKKAFSGGSAGKQASGAENTSTQYDPDTRWDAYALHKDMNFDWKALLLEHGDATYNFTELQRLEEEVAKDDTVFGAALREHLDKRGGEEIRRSSFKLPQLLLMLRKDGTQERGAYIYINASRGLDLVEQFGDVPDSECENYSSATEDYPAEVTADIARLAQHQFVMPWDELAAEMGIDAAKPRVVHSLGAVLRKNKIRIVIDASRGEVPDKSVNDVAQFTGRTCFATVDMAKKSMSRRGKCARCDLVDAFLQSPLSTKSVEICGFKWPDKDGTMRYWGYRTLGFGFSFGPFWQQSLAVACTRGAMLQMIELGYPIGMELTKYDEHQRVSTPAVVGEEITALLSLLDDFAVFGTSTKATHAAWVRLLYVFQDVGIVVSPKPGKTDPPTGVMTYLGIELNLPDMTCGLDEGRVADMQAKLTELLDRGSLTKKELQSIIGVLVFAATVVRCGRPAYRHMLDLLRAHKTSGASGRIVLDVAARSDMHLWQELLRVMHDRTVISGVRMPRCRWEVWTDASYGGWGWHAGCGVWDAGAWPESWTLRMGVSKYRAIWICELEILCCALALRKLAPYMAGSRCVWHVDNLPVVYMLNKHRSVSSRCANVVAEICWQCAVWNIEIEAHHVRTYDNGLADRLSRECEMEGLGAAEKKLEESKLEHMMAEFEDRVAMYCPKGPQKKAMERPDLLPLLRGHTVQLDVWEDKLSKNDVRELERLLPEYLRCEDVQSALRADGASMAAARGQELLQRAQCGPPKASKAKAGRSKDLVKRAAGDRGAWDKGVQ